MIEALNHIQSDPPLTVGNFLLPFRVYLQRLPDASRADKRAIYGELRRMVNIHEQRFARRELTEALRLLESLPSSSDLDDERKLLLNQMRELPSIGYGNAIGVAQVLLVSTMLFRGDNFGAVQPLHVTTYDWGGKRDFLQPERASRIQPSSSAGHGFAEGAQAAIRYLQGKLQGLDATIYLDNHSAEGSLPQLGCPVEGNSLGLGAAIATISDLLKIPVSQGLGFTGFVDRHGAVKEVGGIRAKLQAAVDRDLETVFAPASIARDQDYPEIVLRPVNHISQVIEEVFAAEQIDESCERLRMVRVPPELRRRSWRVNRNDFEEAFRVLISCVGSRDPFGEIARTDGQMVKQEDGPLLTVAREVRPHRVYLFHTVRPDEHESNDFSRYTEAVAQILAQDDPSCEIVPVPLTDVVDPTDFEQLFPAFKDELMKVVNKSPENVIFFVNVSSGTPQIQVIWHMAVERGLIPEGVRLQIRESRFAERKKESRVRRVEPPGW